VSSLAQVVQLPKTFCGNEGVLECSGLTELWMGIERVDGKIQSGVKPPQSKKPWRLCVRFFGSLKRGASTHLCGSTEKASYGKA
jgi:hypothetical protein